MPEIPRAYASPNVPAIAFQAPEFHAQRELARAVQEYGALEERQQLQSYGIEVRTAINNGIIEARTAAAATTDPDQYQQIYQNKLDDTFRALEPTTGGDTRRQLVLGGAYSAAIGRESDNIAAGVIIRRAQLSQVNAERALNLAIDQTAQTDDPVAKQQIAQQFNADVEQMPFLDLKDREKLRESYVVESTVAEVGKRAQAGDALGAMKDLETGVYKNLDSSARRRVRGEINATLNMMNGIADRQQKTDKQVLESMIEAAILDNKPAEEIRSLIRQGVDQRLFGRTDMQAYENRVLGKGGRDTPEQTANFNSFRARFQNETYSAKGLAAAQDEARRMYKTGELGDIGYGSLGGLFRQIENHLDIKAHRGATGGEAGTIKGYDQGASIIRKLYPNLTGDILNRRVAPYMKEYNDAVVSGNAPAVETARGIYTRASREIEAKRKAAKETADAAAKAAADKAKGGVDPTKLNQIQGLAR